MNTDQTCICKWMAWSLPLLTCLKRGSLIRFIAEAGRSNLWRWHIQTGDFRFRVQLQLIEREDGTPTVEIRKRVIIPIQIWYLYYKCGHTGKRFVPWYPAWLSIEPLYGYHKSSILSILWVRYIDLGLKCTELHSQNVKCFGLHVGAPSPRRVTFVNLSKSQKV